MIEKVIEYSIRNRFVVILLAAAVAVWGIYSVLHTPIDAIPDLSENQVIVFTDWMGRSPQEIEDQITYPLSVSLQGLAGVKAVRSSSEFNFSMINIIFEDNIDFYFARERVLERLSIAGTILPPGVMPYMAPDATALGQIFWYTVEGPGHDLGELRSVQDWYVRYQLNAVPGVAQVASVGGYPKEYQIDIDPNRLRAYDVTVGDLYSAVARSNSSVGGRVIHKGNAEYLVRSVGWIRGKQDIEEIVLRQRGGTPVRVRDVATVQLGPEFRRSVLEKDGNEAVGGVVMMRAGENPLEVTKRIKDKIQQLQAGLPKGVRIVPFYDRTRLIENAIHTVTGTLREEIIVASIAVLLILSHVRSAFVICLTLPMSVLISFIFMRYLGVASNIMSLSGIAISIGILVDQAIVMVENATHHLTAHFGDQKVTGDTRELLIGPCRTVGRPIFFSVLIMLISFIPVFALTGMEGKMFHPLALTKSFAMVGVAVLSITLVPALIPTFIRGRLHSEESNWIVRGFINIYKPVLSWAMDFPKTTFWLFVVIVALGWHLWGKLGREFMPPLDEGSVLDMPITVPRASVTEVADDLKARDAVLRQFPEVESVVGKAGRAETPTDPSPLEMVETVVNFRPKELWPKRSLKFDDALRLSETAFQALVDRGLVHAPPKDDDRTSLINDATMNAVARFDALMRELALRRQAEYEPELATALVGTVVQEDLANLERGGKLRRTVTPDERQALVHDLIPEYGRKLATTPALEDVTHLAERIADRLIEWGAASPPRAALLTLKQGQVQQLISAAGEALGADKQTLFTRLLRAVEERRMALWEQRVRTLNWELFDRGIAGYAQYALEELVKAGTERNIAARDATPDELEALRAELETPFAGRVFFWPKLKADLVKEMDSTVQVPGWGNIWTQPIINRIDMLATGVRTMIGVKVFGNDLNQIQKTSEEIAAVLRKVRGAADVLPDQNVGKGYLEITPDRTKAARYGMTIGDIQDTIEVALGGKAITTTVEGRQRYPVRIRYARDFRQDEEAIRRLLVSSGSGATMPADSGSMGSMAPTSGGSTAAPRVQVPLSQVADVRIVEGPAMIKSENGLLRSYVQLNVRDRDIVGFVEAAQRAVAEKVQLPTGMYLEWSGQFEHQVRARKTLQVVFPAVIVLIFVILYMTYNDLMDALLMMMSVPEALAGGIFSLFLIPKFTQGWSAEPIHFSVAVAVGFIACLGMATETGVIMLVYLREAIEKRGGLEKIRSLDELRQAVIEGAVHRLRPKLLTEGVAIIGLAPMLWSTGVGSEIMSVMVAPVLGGLLLSDEVVDLFIPVRFYWVRRRRWLKLHGEAAGQSTPARSQDQLDDDPAGHVEDGDGSSTEGVIARRAQSPLHSSPI